MLREKNDYSSPLGYAQFLLEKKDRMVASEVDRLYNQAKKILVENRAFFDAVVTALIEKKMITYRDL